MHLVLLFLGSLLVFFYWQSPAIFIQVNYRRLSSSITILLGSEIHLHGLDGGKSSYEHSLTLHARASAPETPAW